MFGKLYDNDLACEFFIRTVKYGTFPISELRNIYSMMTNNTFVDVLNKCYLRKIISINKKEKTVTVTKKQKEVIWFIEKTNFVDEMKELYGTNGDIIIPKKLIQYLDKTKFKDRMEENRVNQDGVACSVFFDINDEINRCMMLEKEESYISEITALSIILGKTGENNE